MREAEAPLIVLDTGMVVRALAGHSDSASSRLVRMAGTGEVRLALSDDFLIELVRVLGYTRVEARIGSVGRAFEVAPGPGIHGADVPSPQARLA